MIHLLTESACDEALKVLDDVCVAWSTGDVDKLLSCFIDDCVYEDIPVGGAHQGKAAVRAYAEAVFTAFPDLKTVATETFVSGSFACVEGWTSGTHLGDFPGLPATGKRFSLRITSVAELEGGKIRRFSDYWDFATFLAQVGLLPADVLSGASA